MTNVPEADEMVKRLTNPLLGRPRPLGDVMREAHRRLVSYLDRALHDAGYADVNAAHASVLATVDPGGARLVTLVERGGRTKQATAELAGHLTARGYADLVPDPTDGRAKLYVPTERGFTLLAACEGIVVGYERWLDEVVGPDAVEQLRRALLTIAENDARPRSAERA